MGAAIVVAVNAGTWTRNFSLFGSPLGANYGTVNQTVTPSIVISNAARNAALQLTGPGEGWNRSVEEAVASLHRATVARWLQKARETLLKQTRKIMMKRAGVSPTECDSILRVVQSQFDITLKRLFPE